jgi:hypothetical protein
LVLSLQLLSGAVDRSTVFVVAVVALAVLSIARQSLLLPLWDGLVIARRVVVVDATGGPWSVHHGRFVCIGVDTVGVVASMPAAFFVPVLVAWFYCAVAAVALV